MRQLDFSRTPSAAARAERSPALFFPALLLSVFLFPGEIFADSVQITSTLDNTLYFTPGGTLSNGKGAHMFTGRTGVDTSGTRRCVIAFDVAASIPAGATVTSATLSLNMSRTSVAARNVSLHRLLASWGEGTSDAPDEEGSGTASTTNDATWIHRFHNTSNWTTAGGDFSATVTATQSVNTEDRYEWSSPQLVADVQGWLDAPASSFGWILIGDETGNSTKRFDTHDNPTPANRPILNIEFTPPPIPNAIVWPSGTQTFDDMQDGEDVTRIDGWPIVNGGPAFTVQAEAGPRPDSASTHHLRVIDTDAVNSNRFYSAFATSPQPPSTYTWSLSANLVNAPPATTPVPRFVVQHTIVGGAGAVDIPWGLELRSDGIYLAVYTFGGTPASTLLYSYAGDKAIGEWVFLELGVDFIEGVVYASVNDEPFVSLPISPGATVELNNFRFCYRGEGAGNVMELLIDDIHMQSGLSVPVELGTFQLN